MASVQDDWLEETPAEKSDGEVLYVDVAGYEGPLDLLLDLARRQKVDLVNISILALAEQYLAFIDRVRRMRIEVAADYLVMAAWLAYLKSRMMVPQSAADDEPSGEDLAAALQFRLARLEAMRAAGSNLMRRARLGIEIFARGMPEPIVVDKQLHLEVSLYELLKAYAGQREKDIERNYAPKKRTVWELSEAREILQRLIGQATGDWVSLQAFLSEYLSEPEERASALASSFSASLEMVRQGQLELRQHAAFAPLMMRVRAQKDREPGRR